MSIQNRETKIPITIPIPDISPLNPPLGVVPPLPIHITPLKYTAKLSPLDAVMHGIAYAGRTLRLRDRHGTPECAALRAHPEGARTGGRARAGMAFDGLYYVKNVTHTIKPGEYKQNFTLVRNGLLSTIPRVPAMSEPSKYYGKYRGTVVNNIDPQQIGRIQVIVPDVSLIPRHGPCRACRLPASRWRLHGAPDRRGRMGRV